MNNKSSSKGLAGLVEGKRGVALLGLFIALFVAAALADSVLLSIDYTNPNATILGISESSPFAFVANDSNWTIWYNNASSGNFTVTANAQDNVSGIVNMTWPNTTSVDGTNYTELLPDSSTVGLWHFDENNGTTAYDAGPYGNNGTLLNGANWTSGKRNYAVSFDGVNDQVRMPNIYYDTQTFSVWFKLNQTSLPHDQAIFERMSGSSTDNFQGYRLSVYNTSGKVVLEVNINIVSLDNNSVISSSTLVNDSQWHHAVAVINRTNSTSITNYLYVDGQLEGSDTITVGTYNHNDYLYVGDDTANGGDQHLNGTIDEFVIYNRTLSESEIRALYDLSAPNINFTWRYNWDSADTTNYLDQYVNISDAANNTNTSWNFFNVLLDNVAPTTNDTGPTNNVTWYNTTPRTINLTAVDNVNGSDVNFTRYCVQNASDALCTPSIINYSNPSQVSLSCSGTCYYFVRYFSGDQVGNNESTKSSNKINFAINSTVEENVTADNNTVIDPGSTIYDSGTNLTNATITGNSTVENTTVTDSTINATNVTDSSVSNSTLFNSTVENSTITDSVVNESDVNNSAVDNSIVFNSTVENGSNVTDSNVSDSTVDNSNVTDSTADNATVEDSAIDNSTVTDSTVNLSTVNDSIVANGSTIDNSTVTDGSSMSNSTMEDSAADNSTITDSTVNDSSTVTDSAVANNSVIDNSTVANNSVVSNSTVEDSTSSNSTITDSTVENSSTVVDSTVANNSVLSNTSMTDSVADNSTLTNSTMQNSTASDTTKIRSNNINTTVNLTIETDTNATDSNLTTSNLTLCSLLRSTTGNTIGNICDLTDTVATNSNLSSFTANNCTIDNTSVSNSNCSDSIFNSTTGTGWNVDPSNITGSYCAGGCNVSNSNVTWSNISLSAFYNANFNSSRINLSSANTSSAYNSDVYNSTLVNVSAWSSNVSNSSLRSSGISFISISTIRLVTLSSNYTIVNSTLTNVTLYGSGTIINSTIFDSALNDTSVYRSTITGMTAGNTTINDSTISNPTFNLNDSVITLANINNGMLVYGSIKYHGTTYYGSRTLASIYGPAGPTVSNVQCANESQTFGPCSDIGYGETLWKVRANVTQGDYSISNVVFKLDNLNDGKTLFYGNWVEQNGSNYSFYWNQPVLDSGTFNLTVIATDTQAVTASDYVNWSIPFGSLNVVTAPNSDTNVTKNSTFTFNATYSCSIGECGDINANISFNGTLFSVSPSILLTKSNFVCLGGMNGGSSCTVSWSVTATGNKTQLSEFYAQGLPVNYSANVSDVNSTAINITIVNSPPTTPSIVSPVSGSSVNNLTINFEWLNSTDVDGDDVNYTFQIANNSGYSPLENETNITDSNFTYTVPSTGTWYWRVQAYDNESATSAFATAFVIVSLGGGGGNVTDTTPPLVVLDSPANNAYVQSGSVTFVYTPSEQLSLIANCSLYVNDVLNQTNSTAVANNAENNFTAAFTGEASYNWTVECSDTSTAGPNSGNATSRVLNVDVALPSVSSLAVTYPSGQTEVKDGQSIVVDVNASDSGSGVASVTVNCSSLNSGFVTATLQSGNGTSGIWRATCLVSGLSGFEGDINISATALDGVGFSDSNITAVAVDNLAPENPASLSVSDYPADNDGIVNLTWPNSTSPDITTFNIYRSNVANFTPASGLLIASTADITFTDVPPSDGTWYWKITAVDNLGQENLTGAPENYTLVDTGAPSISNLELTYPTLVALGVTQTRVKDGDVLRITVEAADPQNVSTVWVDVSNINASLTNETMGNIGGDVYEYNATIGGAVGNQIRIYANDTSGNVRNGVYATVAIDNSLPTLDVQDDGNFTATTTSIHASWSYTDADSSALGYQYEIYNNLGETIVSLTTTTSTDVTKSVSPPLAEGLTYFWAVYAYDGAGNLVSNTTAPEGITVDTTPPVVLFVNDDGASTSNTTALNATWLAQDLESGVSRYFYRIGEDNNTDGVVDAWFTYNMSSGGVWQFGIAGNNTSAWANVGSSTSVTATIYNLTTGRRYYFEVKAENWAGVAALGRSDGILETGITDCPMTISIPADYTLANSIAGISGTCVLINASNVSLDCQGFTMDGTSVGGTYGVDNTGGFDNVTIKNCMITNFGTGIYFVGGDNGTIDNNTLSSNNNYGIYLESSARNTLTNNTANSNNFGIYMTSSSNNNTLASNTANSNIAYGSGDGDGIYVTGSTGNNLSYNNASSNDHNGISIRSSSNNTYLFSNTITLNGDQGLRIGDSGAIVTYSVSIIANNISGNGIGCCGLNGIRISNAVGANVSGNTIDSNVDDGIEASTVTNSSFSDNNATNNGANGLYLYSSSDDNNLTANNASSNSGDGFRLDSSSDNRLANNTADLNINNGIYLTSSLASTLSGNDASSNSIAGIYLSSGSYNVLTNNTVSSNTGNGIELYNSPDNNIMTNIANSNSNGIYISFNSDNNNLTTNTANSNYDGIYLGSSSSNTLTGNTVSSNTGNGIELWISSNNNLTANNASLNIINGIYFVQSSGNTLVANNASSNTAGINFWISSGNTLMANNASSNSYSGIELGSSSNDNILTNNIAQNNTLWDFDSSGASLNNTVINLTSLQNTLSFASEDIALKGLTLGNANPTGYNNISKYINATNNSATSWLYINFSYTDADLTTANISESTVRMWKYNETLGNWTNETFYAASQYGINAVANYVFANITEFGSTFAPLGRPNSAPPQVVLYAPANATSTTSTKPTFEWNNATDGEGDTLTYQLQVDDDSSFASPDINVTVAEGSPRTSFTPVVGISLTAYYWRVRAYDGALYGNWSDMRNLVITSPPSGGGGSTTVTSESQAISSIAADVCANAVYTHFSDHGVQTIQLCVNHKVMNVGIQIALRGPTSTPAPGFAYKYMDIFTTGLNDEHVANVTFDFAVPKAWIAQNSIDYRHVRLYRWKDSDWHELATTWLSSDVNYHYYRAVSPGLSVFAISGPQAACPPECLAPGLWATCSNGQTSRTEYFCSVDTGFSCEPKTVTKSCAPELLCPVCTEPSDWSACAEGVQTRTEYVCSAETNYQCVATPVARTCEVPAACSACPEPSTWSACMNGAQSRSAYRCGPETSYACIRVDETISCVPSEALLATAAAIVLILGLGMIVTVRRRAISKWMRKVGKAKFVVPKITMPKPKPYKAEKIVKGAPAMPTVLPTVRPKVLRMPGKPKYVCSVCNKPEILVHWCEECGKETCLEHIHKIGTKLMCDSCMKKKGLL